MGVVQGLTIGLRADVSATRSGGADALCASGTWSCWAPLGGGAWRRGCQQLASRVWLWRRAERVVEVELHQEVSVAATGTP